MCAGGGRGGLKPPPLTSAPHEYIHFNLYRWKFKKKNLCEEQSYEKF